MLKLMTLWLCTIVAMMQHIKNAICHIKELICILVDDFNKAESLFSYIRARYLWCSDNIRLRFAKDEFDKPFRMNTTVYYLLGPSNARERYMEKLDRWRITAHKKDPYMVEI